MGGSQVGVLTPQQRFLLASELAQLGVSALSPSEHQH